MTAAERETIIRWDREDRVVTIWSTETSVWNKCKKLGFAESADCRIVDSEGKDVGRQYETPLDKFRWGKKAKRVLSDEQRAELSARMVQNREKMA